MQFTKKQILALGLTLITICVIAGLFSTLSGYSKLAGVVVSYLGLFALIVYFKLGKREIGLGEGAIGSGARLALPIAVAVIAIFGLTFLIQPEFLKDDRYTMNGSALLFYLLIVMPFMTVILEELAFRGVMLGLLLRHFNAWQAVTVSSIAFGLWHVFSARNVVTPDVGQMFIIPDFLIIATVVVITGAAGALLSLLRLRSGSLIAPILVHWAINASATAYAYLAWH